MEQKDKILITILVILLITIIFGVWMYCAKETVNTTIQENSLTNKENKIEEEITNTTEENKVAEENN